MKERIFERGKKVTQHLLYAKGAGIHDTERGLSRIESKPRNTLEA